MKVIRKEHRRAFGLIESWFDSCSSPSSWCLSFSMIAGDILTTLSSDWPASRRRICRLYLGRWWDGSTRLRAACPTRSSPSSFIELEHNAFPQSFSNEYCLCEKESVSNSLSHRSFLPYSFRAKMDPLSVSASIIALLQLTGTVIIYLNDVRGGPKELQRIRMEISNLQNILFMLQDQADQAEHGESFSSTLCSLKGRNGPFEQFGTTLERLVTKLAPVEGCRKIGRAFKWPFEKKEIHEILNTIERLKALFSLARQNDHIALSKAIGNDIKIMNKEVNEITMGIVNIQIDEMHKKIRQWLFAPDPSSNYNEALKDRHANTGTWFLKTNAYSKWLSQSDSLLWLYGIPGCGKTILSSTIVQSTVGYCQSRTNSVVLYFYFDFNDVEKQGHEKMIRSLITQLFSQCANTSQALASLYSSCMNGERQPTNETLLETLHQMMRGFEETYLVIDALDECLKRDELLTNIEQLTSWKDANLHILTTSRKEREIEESIELLTDNQERICIQSALVSDDIRAYVRDRLRTDRGLRRWQKQPKVQQEIEDMLMDKADGM